MTLTAAQLASHLGYFGPFMHAWRLASPENRAELYADALAYTAGREDAVTLVAQTGQLLGVSPSGAYR